MPVNIVRYSLLLYRKHTHAYHGNIEQHVSMFAGILHSVQLIHCDHTVEEVESFYSDLNSL